MIVSMDKKYTLRREAFTLLTVTKPGQWPVIGYTPDGDTYEFTADGSSITTHHGLVEVSPYADFKIDEPVMVRDGNHQEWQRRHFAGVNAAGEALTWSNGATKWATTLGPTMWYQCRRPTAEELAT